MSKSPKPALVLKLDPFPYHLHVLLSVDELEPFKKHIRMPEHDNPMGFVASNRQENFLCLFIDLEAKVKTHTIDQVRQTLVHECVHIWQRTRHWIDEPNPGEEVEAYFIDHIFGAIAPEVQRRYNALDV